MTNVLRQEFTPEHITLNEDESVTYEDKALGDMADFLDRTVKTLPPEVTRAFTARDPERVADILTNSENPDVSRYFGSKVASILDIHRP